MARIASLLALLGLALATGLIVWSGWGQVMQALAQAGWGILAVALFHLVPLVTSSTGWWVLVPRRRRPSLPMFVYFMWVRAAVNNLMPVARIGGEIAAVRLMQAAGMRQSTAIAATVVELTLSVAAVFLFIAIGLLLFGMRIDNHDTTIKLIEAALLALPILAGLIAVQRIGFFTLLLRLFRKLFRDKYARQMGNAARLDRAVAALYRNHRRVLACGLLQFVAWALGSVEIWLSLRFLGHPLAFIDSIMLEALIQASSSAAFAIPGALGVQEAGFVLFGSMLGLGADTAIALAVMRRCRDLICYAPGLIVWQIHEGRKLWRA